MFSSSFLPSFLPSVCLSVCLSVSEHSDRALSIKASSPPSHSVLFLFSIPTRRWLVFSLQTNGRSQGWIPVKCMDECARSHVYFLICICCWNGLNGRPCVFVVDLFMISCRAHYQAEGKLHMTQLQLVQFVQFVLLYTVKAKHNILYASLYCV